MNEIRKAYQCNRKIHVRPFAEACINFINHKETVGDTSLNAYAYNEDCPEREVPIVSPIGMMTNLIGYPKGCNVIVRVEGNQEESKLEEIADEIGSIFELETNEEPTNEWFHRTLEKRTT